MIPCDCNNCSSAGKCELEAERREKDLFNWARGEQSPECLLRDEIKDRGGR